MRLKLLVREDDAKPVAVTVDDRLDVIDGVKSIDLDIANGTLTVVFDVGQISLGTIKVVYSE